MSRKVGFRVGAVLAAVTLLFAVTASAVAAGGTAPRLGSPNHRHVSPGRIKLVVYVPQAAASGGVFIKIQPTRKTSKGHLPTKCTVSKRCQYVQPHHVKGHKYEFVATAGSFPGYWATTPGKLYWQAQYYTASYTANYYSSIGTFYVK
jgi:hypothetical protein